MSKSPKSLSTLASSLQLSSISRVVARSPASGGHHVTKYIVRDPSTGSCVVVRHRRHASTSSNPSSSASANVPSSTRTSASRPSSPTTPRSTSTASSALSSRNRATSSAPSSSSSSSSALLGRTASLNGSTSSSSKVAFFHSNARASHQQPLSSSSSSSSPLTPPPSSPSSNHHSSYSKHSSSSGLPTSDPSALLLTPYHHVPSSGSSLSTDSSSSSSATLQASSTHSGTPSAASSGAALFNSDHAHSYPQQNLPSFFGTTLSIARRSNFVFRNGAYGIPKAGRDLSVKGKEKDEATGSELDHFLSVGIGEDAYFLRADSLGVADGVGGWSGHAGANPARWSRKLMHHCSNELARYENVDDELFLRYYEVDPVEILQRAFEKSLAECKDEGVIGSSTALLAVLRNDELRLANMGDCCCSIIRGDDYIFRSEEQQHSFNFPVQAGTNSKDTPIKDAQRFNIKVQKDDIVILSSDGLMDNLYDEDILEEVLRFVASSPAPPTSSNGKNVPSNGSPRYTLNKFSPQAVSEALSLRAKSVYEDPRAVSSPFQQRAVEEGIHFVGGKRDDITTLIGVVGELEASQDRR